MLKDALLKVKILDGAELDKRLMRTTVKFENDLTVTLPNSLIHFEEKVVIPKFVANWIESCKRKRWTLYLSMSEAGKNEDKVCEWIFGLGDYDHNNQETFALAWINDYEVEKEKRYLVKIIGITNYNSYLNYHKGENKWTIESRMEIDAIRTEHTRKELEDAGFGWVFDCEGIEIEEVEE